MQYQARAHLLGVFVIIPIIFPHTTIKQQQHDTQCSTGEETAGDYNETHDACP